MALFPLLRRDTGLFPSHSPVPNVLQCVHLVSLPSKPASLQGQPCRRVLISHQPMLGATVGHIAFPQGMVDLFHARTTCQRDAPSKYRILLTASPTRPHPQTHAQILVHTHALRTGLSVLTEEKL